MNVWEQIKQNLLDKVTGETYANWVSHTTLLDAGEDCLTVGVPNEVNKEWLQCEYAEEVRSAISELKLPYRRVVYELDRGAWNGNGQANGAARSLERSPFLPQGVQLNPKFTFDKFVVGSCNQLAHAAAKAVATMPSRSYNPLFIYGGVGMGKTHLMHAIGRHLTENFAGMRIVYTTSERFMNEMINCIKLDRMPEFHRHFRCADVLLVDDIQTLAGKERTQEEFFHTFNDLYDHQKQIVISSDSAPKSTHGLVERLRSRFEWGLLVDVQAPDLETKMAILDKKAEDAGVHLPEDVRIYLATKTKSNVRELEGALIKLIANSSLTGMPITLAAAQQTLRNVVQAGERRVTIDQIVKAVAEKFSLSAAILRQKSSVRHISYPRQIAMYLAKDLTSASLPEIGRYFGGKHHTTVLHSVQKIEKQRETDPDLNRMLHSLSDSLT